MIVLPTLEDGEDVLELRAFLEHRSQSAVDLVASLLEFGLGRRNHLIGFAFGGKGKGGLVSQVVGCCGKGKDGEIFV